jgi:hypothetical protein
MRPAVLPHVQLRGDAAHKGAEAAVLFALVSTVTAAVALLLPVDGRHGAEWGGSDRLTHPAFCTLTVHQPVCVTPVGRFATAALSIFQYSWHSYHGVCFYLAARK